MKRGILFSLIFACFSVSAQNMIQMEQLPLLTSPSFTGNDTSARVIMAMQKHGVHSEKDMFIRNQSSEAYFASFDMRNAAKTKAFGGYVSYSKVGKTAGQNRGYESLNTQLGGYIYSKYTDLAMDKLEVGLSFVPVFGQISFIDKNKKWNLIPALLFTYSHHNTKLDGFEYDGWKSGALVATSERDWKDSVYESKDLTFDRVSVGGSLLLQSSRLFFSYQMALRYDQVALEMVNNQSRIDHQNGYSTSGFYENYRKGYAQFANYLTVGGYFPRNHNAFVQFNPIIMTSFILSRVNNNNNNGYGKKEPMYDHGNHFFPTVTRLSFNVRVLKFLAGFNVGADGHTEIVRHYYVGYRTPKVTITAGIANKDIYNTSLQYNFR